VIVVPRSEADTFAGATALEGTSTGLLDVVSIEDLGAVPPQFTHTPSKEINEYVGISRLRWISLAQECFLACLRACF
jgi:hypothetical protein